MPSFMPAINSVIFLPIHKPIYPPHIHRYFILSCCSYRVRSAIVHLVLHQRSARIYCNGESFRVCCTYRWRRSWLEGERWGLLRFYR